jgi:geranylgeranyl pyrophosphate synthase
VADADFANRVPGYRSRVDAALERRLPAPDSEPAVFHQAMRYSALGPGKRLRPLLAYATGEVLGIDPVQIDPIAVSIEMLHAYSLVHDDLPAMDDDDLRRGRPTCHREFDEATAILAGDALQALAFYIISHDPKMTPHDHARLTMITNLALFSGSRGMAGGQAIDLESVGKSLNIAELETMHIHKTGALIRTCIQLAALSAPQLSDGDFKALDSYAKCIGLSFQVQDDILDVTGDTATLGKTQGSDSARNKPTFPSIIGLQASQEKALELHQQALQALSIFAEEADILRYISAWFVQRTH